MTKEERLALWQKMLDMKQLTPEEYQSLLRGEEDIEQMKGE